MLCYERLNSVHIEIFSFEKESNDSLLVRLEELIEDLSDTSP